MGLLLLCVCVCVCLNIFPRIPNKTAVLFGLTAKYMFFPAIIFLFFEPTNLVVFSKKQEKSEKNLKLLPHPADNLSSG